MRFKKFPGRALSLVGLSLLLFTMACSSPTPQVVEVTRVVPQVLIITQVVTPIVTEAPTPTPEPTATPTITPVPTEAVQVYYPLNECGPSIVKPGGHVMVSYDGGKSAIRSTPDLAPAGNILGYALPGEYLKVISGPVCSYQRLMWMVETAYGLTGWTPEGDGKEKWYLIPVAWWQVPY